MKNSTRKQAVSFTLAESVSTNHHTGTYPSGRKWSKWSQIFRGQDGVLYKHFGKAVPVSRRCTITGTYAGISPYQYQGEKVVQIKNATAIPAPPPEDTEEVEAEAMGDNIAQHREDNPHWWIDEVRNITEDDVCFKRHSLTPDQEAAEAYANELEALRASKWSEYIRETKNL